MLSRGGASDFHALAAAGERVVAFDGALRTSTDGRTRTVGHLASPPRALAIADGNRVLATTADGLMTSSDGGARWSALPGAPRLLFVDWADSAVVAGLDPEGTLHLSSDAGRTWRVVQETGSNPQAIEASESGGRASVTVATEEHLLTFPAP